CADGTVSRVNDGSGNHAYGIHVRINHRDGYQTIYAHLTQALVTAGQLVVAGERIGLGSTSRLTLTRLGGLIIRGS
ncbi:MAG: Peptidase family, partial [Chloroflexota bacterium]